MELPGNYDIFCTEYCGLGHSGMVSKVVAMEDKDFDAWDAAAAPTGKKAGEKSGENILGEKGCIGCHTTDGTPRVGPTFKGVYGSRVTAPHVVANRRNSVASMAKACNSPPV